MSTHTISNSYTAQCARLLRYLKENGTVTTLQARHLLAVMHPAGRIKDLRNAGYTILTYWVFDTDSTGVRHRQGLYVLKAGDNND